MTSTLSLAFGFSWLVSVACQIGVIVAIATVVRRHRPDAHGALLAWAIAGLVWSLVHQVLITIGPAVLRTTSSTEGVLGFHAGVSVLGSVVHVGLILLLVRGLVKLAQPPRVPAVDPVGPYR